MQVRFVDMDGPSFFVEVRDGPGESHHEECWPVVTTHRLEGEPIPFRFAWDRHHRVLYVDRRWPALDKLSRPVCEGIARDLAREVMKRAAEEASGG